MNSFTSSFKTEAKVIAIVLVTLLACELALRKFETSLSLDLEHIRSIPALADHLTESKKLRILFVGNSFTRVSVDTNVFLDEMKAQGFPNVAVQRVFPDGTQLNEWYHALKTYFVEPNLSPDLAVFITGRAHLQDRRINSSVFGAYFSGESDVGVFFRHPDYSLDNKLEFLLARYCAVAANRHRIEPRVFSYLIPHYQECIQRINEEQLRNAAGLRKRRPPSYQRLEQLLELGENNSMPIVIATVPMARMYNMDPKIPRLIEAHGMTFIEAHNIEGLDASHFPDGYHIDPPGAEKYTRKLAAEIARKFDTNPVFQKAR